MKKIFAYMAFAMAGLGMASAQNFTVNVEGQEVTEGATIEVSSVIDPADWNAMTVVAHWTLTNTSAADLVFAATMEGATPLPEGASWQNCSFGSCAATWEIPDQTIAAGATVGGPTDLDPVPFDFAYRPASGDYNPWTVNCVFTDKTAGASLNFSIRFVPLPKGEDTTANEGLDRVAISAYPNPTMGEVHFMLANVKAGSKVVLRDMNGRVVESVAVKGETELSMNLEALNAGVYFYSVEENGKAVVTRKLVVR